MADISRWSLGEAFTEALQDAASEAAVAAAMTPVESAISGLFDGLRTEIMDRMPEAINDEVRYRTDKIIEALLQGDEKLLGSFMAAGGYRAPGIEWDGRFRSGYWVEVRRKITEANEAILRDERVADITAERNALAAELVDAKAALGRMRGELAEAKDALHWATVRAEAAPKPPVVVSPAVRRAFDQSGFDGPPCGHIDAAIAAAITQYLSEQAE